MWRGQSPLVSLPSPHTTYLSPWSFKSQSAHKGYMDCVIVPKSKCAKKNNNNKSEQKTYPLMQHKDIVLLFAELTVRWPLAFILFFRSRESHLKKSLSHAISPAHSLLCLELFSSSVTPTFVGSLTLSLLFRFISTPCSFYTHILQCCTHWAKKAMSYHPIYFYYYFCAVLCASRCRPFLHFCSLIFCFTFNFSPFLPLSFAFLIRLSSSFFFVLDPRVLRRREVA